MEKGLLDKEGEGSLSLTGISSWRIVYGEEVKRVACIAGPLVAVNLSQYFLQIIAVMMVGHLGELYLSSTAIAISFCAVTGFSLVFGMSTALETLNGQAYGAQQYQKLGTQTYTALFCLILVCFPLSLMWVFMEKILIFMGQDALISREAGRFTIWLIPALFGYASLQSLVRLFQAQSLTFPLLVCSCVTLVFHLILCWVLVFKSGFGNLGAALAIGLSYWLNVLLLVLYFSYSSSCETTRVAVSMELFQGVGQFFRLAIPSAFMICLEWWSFEFLTMLSGLLPNPELETSVLSVCLATISTLYTIPDGLGAAASTRVSNELGAGNPQAASIAVKAVMFLAVSEAITALQGAAAGRTWGLMSIWLHTICVELQLQPCWDSGWSWEGQGLWIGIQAGALLQTVLLIIITSCTNWEKQVSMARERVFHGRFAPENEFGSNSSFVARKSELERCFGRWVNKSPSKPLLVRQMLSVVGMLWTGETPEAKAVDENMVAYFNTLQGFLLHTYGSTVGAGPTLSSAIHASVKQVVDSSFKLMKESVNLYGSRKDQAHAMPQFVGAVWEACTALKKTPATNITAIGRAMTQVAVSMKDVLREMKELKPGPSDPNEASDDASTNADTGAQDDENFSLGDLGNDLSPEEMKVAQLAIGLLKLENPDDNGKFVDSLEKILKLCQGLGLQIDELGACLYPPQEVSAMKTVTEKILSITDELQTEVESFKSSSEAFIQGVQWFEEFIETNGL
ncbi:hypothetical protein Patl1_15207 [Pistacia atlantica]|uniref:Uncharacterized protein n=1 Tax=Pistacia atlantica TaxID=434234 RepID=A0ACC1B7V7_9ROSI|nr:hypothetical protein Patl1_15207 [Pistacia atlantica]